jgi:dihydrofolate reductase
VIVSAIVAAAANDVIGADGALPWQLPEDLRRFRSLTMGHVVVMGRATHESILARLGRPLPGRTSVVVSSAAGASDAQVRYEPSVAAALAAAARLAAAAGDHEFFVIGGASIFEAALASIERVYLTRLHQEFEGDRFMPPGWLSGFELRRTEHGSAETEPAIAFSFLDYHRAAP